MSTAGSVGAGQGEVGPVVAAAGMVLDPHPDHAVQWRGLKVIVAVAG